MRSYAFGWPNNNDNIFPALPAAQPYIDFDGRGFLVHGKRTFIVSGELQYPRTPRAQWRERLLRIKRAGYNTVQTYAFWNYHEPREGQFEFTGEKDLNAYLQTIHSLGMYAIVRMGPYVNAEWDTGGLPVWLRFKPGLIPMTDNPAFYSAVTPYFNKLVPILVANQINHGGPILMVQMENEHVLGPPLYAQGAGGGTDLPNSYYKWFYRKMRAMGLQVPLFFSGLNHSDDPAGDSPFDTSQRTSPWYSTEFWTGWVGFYGVDPNRGKKLERATWKVIAYGGSGYTHYTMAGGTDFDTWNNNEQASSYDFGSPIGQAGDLRDDYYYCKRAAMFATSFSDLLSNSLAKDGGDGATPTGANVNITNRKGSAGEVLFLDNRTGSPIPTQIKIGSADYPSAGPILLAPGEIVPIMHGYPLAPGVNLTLAAARLLGIARHGTMTTLVAYGNPNEPVEMHFTVSHPSLVRTDAALSMNAAGVVLKTTVPAAKPNVSIFQAGGQTVRVLTMSTEMADRTWFLQDGALIACGLDYVGEVIQASDGSIRLATERSGLGAAPSHPLPSLLYLSDTSRTPLSLVPVSVPNSPVARATPPTLRPWMADSSVPMAQPNYNDAEWKASPGPLPMGADGDYSAYAWYRTVLTVPTAGTYQINVGAGGDWVSCFVNGQHASSYLNPSPRRLSVDLRAGTNKLAFLTAHYGRNKLFNYYGLLDTIDAKGIVGPVKLTKSAGVSQDLNAFRWQADDQAPTDSAKQAAPDLDTSGAAWADASTATDVFQGRLGWAWFRIALPNVPGPHRNIFFHSIDDSGNIYLNGKQIATNIGLNADASISLDSAWKDSGPNVLAVAVQNTGGPGGLTGEVRLESGLEDGQKIHGWKMKGGVTYPAFTSAAWKPISAAGNSGIPTFCHTTFQDTPPGLTGPHPILRMTFANLSRGFVWLNGRNLGRYPEKSPVDSIYFPESLLKAGKNDVVIFDEDGNSPANVKIVVETGTSRTGSVLKAVAAK
ncbi:MAG: beta-galactosidase [Janthinobacterium lividum]